MGVIIYKHKKAVSTHSRLKAAGNEGGKNGKQEGVSTHSRLKAAGFSNFRYMLDVGVSTHSRLKAAGQYVDKYDGYRTFQHTAA